MDHSQDCFPRPKTVPVGRKMARPMALKTGPLFPNHLGASVPPQATWWESLAKRTWNFPDSSLMEWLEHTTLNYCRFPPACEMLWFWRSLYRIISLLMQVCRKENTHFLSFFPIFSLISHVCRTPIVWKFLSQMPWGRESRPQRVRQDYQHEEIFERRGEMPLKKSLLPPPLCLVSKR